MENIFVQASQLTVNCVIYHYDDFDRIVYLKRSVVGAGFEEVEDNDDFSIYDFEVSKDDRIENKFLQEEIKNKKKEIEPTYVYDSVRHAKKRLKNIALLNDWDYFCTFTFDPKEFNSKSPKDVYRAFKSYIWDKAYRKGMKYFLVPEYHKDQEKIHVHFLLNTNDHDLKIEKAINPNTGKQLKSKLGHNVFNMTDWKWGHSTVVKMDGNKQRVANYVSKYITKDLKMIFGNYYIHSNGLKLDPDKDYYQVTNDYKDYLLENGAFESDYAIILDKKKI